MELNTEEIERLGKLGITVITDSDTLVLELDIKDLYDKWLKVQKLIASDDGLVRANVLVSLGLNRLKSAKSVLKSYRNINNLPCSTDDEEGVYTPIPESDDVGNENSDV